MDDRIQRAKEVYEQAVFGGDTGGLEDADRGLDAVEADVLLARGRIKHARYLRERPQDGADTQALKTTELESFEQAAAIYRRLGDVRGEGEALFWLGVFYQVVQGDNDTAVGLLETSYAMATRVDDKLTMSYALRHLGVAAHMGERLDDARAHLEQSTALRREIGFPPGVAANLVGLTYVAWGQGRRDDASDLIAEARAIARSSEAHAIMKEIDEAEAVVTGNRPLTPPMMSEAINNQLDADKDDAHQAGGY